MSGEISAAPQASIAAGTATAWMAVGLLILAYILSYVDRTIILLLVGPIRADLAISDTEFSLLQGLAFAVLYTLAGIPIAALADRADRARIIAAGIATWSVMTILCGYSRTFWQLFIARVGVGIGEAALSPPAYSLITDLAPRPQLARALAAYGAAVYVGTGFTFLFGGWLVDSLVDSGGLDWWWLRDFATWQQVMILVGLPGIPIAAAALFFLPEPRRGGGGAHAGEVGALLPFLAANWRFIAALFAGFSFVSLLFNGYLAWVAEYFLRAHGWSKSRTGLWIGSILLVCGPLGMAVGGWATDAMLRRRPVSAPVRVGLLGALLLLPWPLWATVVRDPWLSLAGIVPIIFLSCLCFGPAVVAIQLTTPAGLRARVSAVYLFAVNIAGIGLGGTAIAAVSDSLLGNEARIGEAMAIVGTVAILLAVLCLWVARNIIENQVPMGRDTKFDPSPDPCPVTESKSLGEIVR